MDRIVSLLLWRVKSGVALRFTSRDRGHSPVAVIPARLFQSVCEHGSGTYRNISAELSKAETGHMNFEFDFGSDYGTELLSLPVKWLGDFMGSDGSYYEHVFMKPGVSGSPCCHIDPNAQKQIGYIIRDPLRRRALCKAVRDLPAFNSPGGVVNVSAGSDYDLQYEWRGRVTPNDNRRRAGAIMLRTTEKGGLEYSEVYSS